ncbi:MAG TPA: PhzF family phenazine biosynthesis protein [Sporichthya sp.]|nr:PhzF family phenazine biosynthesis protein [Sporichthya sp.]
MPYEYAIADVFTDRSFGGNQLAVVLDAQGLSTEQMQAIAREFNFAETTFVLPPDEPGATARLRIFTPGAELPFAGHPTVGSAAVLGALGRVPVTAEGAHVVFHEQVGPVEVSVTGVGGALAAELRLAAVLTEPASAPPTDAVAAALSLPGAAVLEAWYAGVGMACGFARLASEADVDAARLDPAAWASAFAGGTSPILHFFAGDLVDGADLYARMFAPELGISEDPATGGAVAALVACLAQRDGRPDATVHLTVRQGFRMGRPSYLRASARTTGGRLEYVTVGGGVALFATGVLDAQALS